MSIFEPVAARRPVEALTSLRLWPIVPIGPWTLPIPSNAEPGCSRSASAFSLSTIPNNLLGIVDLFAEAPWDFEALWSNAFSIPLGHLTPRVASIPEFLRMKQQTGRPIDLDDIQHLAAIELRRKQPSP